MEPQPPKYREKVLIGLENAPSSFDVRGKVMGPSGANLQYITNETGAIVTIRGKGSGYVEPSTGHESVEPLHICVEHSKYEVLQAGRQLAFNLIETVQQEWSNIQQQQPTQTEPQTQTNVHQHVQSIPLHSQLVAGSGGSDLIQPTNGTVQLQLPIFTPPPSLSVPPPPIQIAPQPPLQVSVGSGTTTTSTGTGTGGTGTGTASSQQVQVQVQVGGGSSETTTATGGQTTTTVGSIVQNQHQTSAIQPTPEIQHQIQIQPQQLYVSQGGGVMQPATLIPQPTTSIINHQPQMLSLAQASYPIQYVQANNGQMVFAYPNIVRPAETNATQQPQVMLVQYAPQRPIVQGRTTTQSHTIPQIVQIVNPQTGQVQHLLQHVQPQIQMQQLALTSSGVGGGGQVVNGQVLMPAGNAGGQQQHATQTHLLQGGQPIQFTQAAQHALSQGMIITSQQPHQLQVAVSQASLQQQTERSSPQVVQQHQVISQQQVRPTQGIKRRFENTPLLPNYQSIPPPQQVQAPTMTIQTVRKGIGSEGIQQTLRVVHQAQQQHLQQQQILGTQQTQQLVQQIQLIQQQQQTEEGQVTEEKGQQSNQQQTDEWRFQENLHQQPHQQVQERTVFVQAHTSNASTINNDGNKGEPPKRGRPAHNVDTKDSTVKTNYIQFSGIKAQQQPQAQPQQQAQQQTQQQVYDPATGSYQSYSATQAGYQQIYQQPPPQAQPQQPSYQQYSSWLLPQ